MDQAFKLTDRVLTTRLALADIAARGVPTYELLHPADQRPRLAIEMFRRFANGSACASTLEGAHLAAHKAADRHEHSTPSWSIAHGAVMASTPAQMPDHVDAILDDIAAAIAAKGDGDTELLRYMRERRWQIARLIARGVNPTVEDWPVNAGVKDSAL